MKTNTILSITIAELERLKAGVVTVLTNLTEAPESFVVVKGKSLDGLSHFVLGVLYLDQIPPTGEKEGFRIQRIQDLNGVYIFNEVDAHFNAALYGAEVLPYRVWLAQCFMAFKELTAGPHCATVQHDIELRNPAGAGNHSVSGAD